MPEGPIDVSEMLDRNDPGFGLAAGEESFPEIQVVGEVDEDDVWRALEDVEDPELPVSVVGLGLIRKIEVDDDHVDVTMTLTYTGCPAREVIVEMVRKRCLSLPGIERADVELSYDDPWSPEDMTDEARERLGDAGYACPLAGNQ